MITFLYIWIIILTAIVIGLSLKVNRLLEEVVELRFGLDYCHRMKEAKKGTDHV